MPKLFNTNILVILLASFVFFMLGSVWYGMLFGETWMTLNEIDRAAAEANMGRAMAVGFLLSVLQAAGLAGIYDMASGKGVAAGIKSGFLTWLFFALPITAYAWNYEGRSFTLTEIDAGYLLVGYLLIGLIYGLFRKQ